MISCEVIALAACAVRSFCFKGSALSLTPFFQLRCALEELELGYFRKVEFSVAGFHQLYTEIYKDNIVEKISIDEALSARFTQLRDNIVRTGL